MGIVVTTTADVVNGNVVTVAGLLASPGPDGVSLREAVEATNNDPGSYTIGFATALAGRTITLLPHDGVTPNRGPLQLIGGGVRVSGDVDADGKPDLTIRQSPREQLSAFHVSSSRNTLHALELEGFRTGVQLQAAWRGPGFPSRLTFADNVVSSLVIRGGAGTVGIGLDSYQGGSCDAFTRRCATYNRWTNTKITRNTIATGQFAIILGITSSIGDRIEGVEITDNRVRLGTGAGPARGGHAIGVDQHGNAKEGRISDVLVARNTIEGVNGDGGIVVAAGLQRSPANTIEGVRILDNRIHLVRKGQAVCCHAIVVTAGVDTWAVDTQPVEYPNRNVVRNVEVARNTVTGSLAAGVKIAAGVDAGGSRNRIENVRVVRNTIRSTATGRGVYLWSGQIAPFRGAHAAGNLVTSIAIDRNRIVTGRGPRVPGETFGDAAGGIVLLGGWHNSRSGTVKNVRIRSNRISSPHAGIRLIGGIGPKARGNSVRCVRLARNSVTGTRKLVVVTPNQVERPGEGPTPGKAKGNRATLGGCRS